MLDELRSAARKTGSERCLRGLLIDCKRLLSERGEANSAGIAHDLVARFSALPDEQQGTFFERLPSDFSPDPKAVLKSAQAYAEAPNAQNLARLTQTTEPPRQELLRRINRSPGGTSSIVAMRRALLARVAKKYLVTYSRYADDITISTNQKIFPSSIYTQSQNTEINSDLGKELTDTIKNAGFRVNNAKTRLQSNDSRQLVTGLTVNAKVNIRSDYYRTVRAICHRLFAIGTFYRKQSLGTSKKDETSLDVVEGMLSHIYQIKIAKQALHIQTDETAQKALRELYRQFLFYRRFVALEFPLVICEGITDNIYLKCAIQNLPEFHPKLGSFSDELFRPKIGFFSYSNKVHRHLKITGGTGSLVTFISQYEKHLRKYKNIPLRNPVIVLSDNYA